LDDDPLPLQLLVLLLLILLNAFFAAAEVALLSIKPASLRKLEQQGDRRARKLILLAADSGRFLSTIQVGVTFAGFLASAFAADSFSKPLADFMLSSGLDCFSPNTLRTLSVVLVTLMLSYLSLVFGELIPKQLGLRFAEAVALHSAGPVSFFATITGPFVWILNHTVSGLLKMFKVSPHDRNNITEEEIRLMVDIGEENGTINSDERQMIENIFEFNNICAEEVMTHRTDMVAVNLMSTPHELEEVFRQHGFTRVPVFRDSIDQIIGFLHIRDYFSAKISSNISELTKLLKPVYLAPASMRANILFRNMQREKYAMAIVLDEYGGTAGLVTIEDLLEEIVGSLYDEFDDPEIKIETLGPNTWLIDGSMRTDEVSKETRIELPESDFDTIGGLVFEHLNEVPAVGDEVELPDYHVKLVVEVASDRRINKVLMVYTPPEDEQQESSKEETPE
jgi:putative hemolysin